LDINSSVIASLLFDLENRESVGKLNGPEKKTGAGNFQKRKKNPGISIQLY